MEGSGLNNCLKRRRKLCREEDKTRILIELVVASTAAETRGSAWPCGACRSYRTHRHEDRDLESEEDTINGGDHGHSDRTSCQVARAGHYCCLWLLCHHPYCAALAALGQMHYGKLHHRSVFQVKERQDK